MTLTHPKAPTGLSHDLAVAPLFSLEREHLPRHRITDGEMSPDVA